MKQRITLSKSRPDDWAWANYGVRVAMCLGIMCYRLSVPYPKGLGPEFFRISGFLNTYTFIELS
jgi:hypothetical protein